MGVRKTGKDGNEKEEKGQKVEKIEGRMKEENGKE